MRLSDDRLEEIKQIIVELLEKYNICSFPISGFEIATKMGIKVIPYSAYEKNPRTLELLKKMSEEGYFVERFKDIYIFYNDRKKSYGRINNTIAHEIGHIVLGHVVGKEREEAEAKFFAKYLLAPPPLVDSLKLKNYFQLERVFQISNEASFYAWDYYQKWLNYGNKTYTSYEKRLLNLFKNSIEKYNQHNI